MKKNILIKIFEDQLVQFNMLRKHYEHLIEKMNERGEYIAMYEIKNKIEKLEEQADTIFDCLKLMKGELK